MANYRKKRRNKFNNVRCEFDGLKFDSKKEMERYKFLLEKKAEGVIYDLVVHPRFPFILPDGRKVLIKGEKRNTCARYTADFSYYLSKDGPFKAKEGRYVVEDMKSPATAKEGQFKLRRAVFELIYGVDLELVYKVSEWKW